MSYTTLNMPSLKNKHRDSLPPSALSISELSHAANALYKSISKNSSQAQDILLYCCPWDGTQQQIPITLQQVLFYRRHINSHCSDNITKWLSEKHRQGNSDEQIEGGTAASEYREEPRMTRIPRAIRSRRKHPMFNSNRIKLEIRKATCKQKKPLNLNATGSAQLYRNTNVLKEGEPVLI